MPCFIAAFQQQLSLVYRAPAQISATVIIAIFTFHPSWTRNILPECILPILGPIPSLVISHKSPFSLVQGLLVLILYENAVIRKRSLAVRSPIFSPLHSHINSSWIAESQSNPLDVTSPPPAHLVQIPTVGDGLNHTVTPKPKLDFKSISFLSSNTVSVSDRHTFIPSLSWQSAHVQGTQNLPASISLCLNFYSQLSWLTEKSPCPSPGPEDLLGATPNTATRHAQALVKGEGGGCSCLPELPAPAHIPLLFDAIPKQVLPETRPSPFSFNSPTNPTSETLLSCKFVILG